VESVKIKKNYRFPTLPCTHANANANQIACSPSSISMTDSSAPPVTIRYRFNMAPDRLIISKPTLQQIGNELNKVDLAVFLGTVLIPSIYGYRIQSKRKCLLLFCFIVAYSTSNIIKIIILQFIIRIFFYFLFQIWTRCWYLCWRSLRLQSELLPSNRTINSNPKIL
jgi:hypothetical protein